jgi:hypothetical protein
LVAVSIRNIPVDVGRLAGFACAMPPEPYADRDTGEARTDRETGLPLYQVGITVRVSGTREAEVLTIQVPGEPVGVVVDEPVTLHGLTVAHWSREGRSGLTYRASAITPRIGAVAGSSSVDAAKPGAGTSAAGGPGGKAAARE